MKKVIFTKEQEEEIKKLYIQDHISMTKIGEKFQVSKTVIRRILTKQTVEIRTDNHTYKANYRAFQNIDSAEKAYWLGFIAADGCVFERETNGSVKLNIHQRDEEILIKLKNFLQSNVPIRHIIQNDGFSNNTPMSRIDFNSLEMVQDFKQLGVPPKKSLILKPPLIQEQYFLPYIAGYFDGDGSIFQLKNNEWGISIEGTKEILEWINSILHISSILEQRNINSDKNNYYIRCGGTKKPYEIMKKIYESTPVHLERKYQKFLELHSRFIQ